MKINYVLINLILTTKYSFYFNIMHNYIMQKNLDDTFHHVLNHTLNYAYSAKEYFFVYLIYDILYSSGNQKNLYRDFDFVQSGLAVAQILYELMVNFWIQHPRIILKLSKKIH